MADTDPRNTEQSYVYHTPASSYNYPNKPFEPFPQKEPIHPKKKHTYRIPICIVSILLILGIGLFLSYRYIPSVKRFVYKNILSTEKYYLYMENTNLKNDLSAINDFSEETGMEFTGTNRSSTPVQGSINLLINSELYEMQSNIHNYHLAYTYEPTKEHSRTSMVFSYDKTDLLSVDFLENDKKQYLLFPELSDSYVDITDLLRLLTSSSENASSEESPGSSSLTSSYLNNEELLINLLSTIDDDMLVKFLDRYSTSFIEDVSKYSNITLDEDVSLDLSRYNKNTKENFSPTLECDKFTVSITTDAAITILQNLLSLVRTDDDVVQLVEAAGVDSFYFYSALTYISVQLETYKTYNSQPFITMELYTNGNDIVCRNMHFDLENPYEFVLCSYEDTDSHLFYTSLGETSKDTKDFLVSVGYRSEESGATGGGLVSLGDADLMISFEDITEEYSTYSILPTGTLTIQIADESSEDGINDSSIVYKGSVEDSKMEACITIGNKTTTLLDLSMSFEAYESKAYDFPDEHNDVVSATDEKQLKEYLETSSLEKVLDSFSSSFSIKINEEDFTTSILNLLDSLQ